MGEQSITPQGLSQGFEESLYTVWFGKPSFIEAMPSVSSPHLDFGASLRFFKGGAWLVKGSEDRHDMHKHIH